MLHWFHALPNRWIFILIGLWIGLPMVAAPYVLGKLTGRPSDP